MAQAYIRQSTFADGDTITAALFNDEYNQLVNAFAYSSSSASSTGHRHDGTAGQGGNIFKIGDLDFLNKIEVDSSNNRLGFYVEVSAAAVEQIRIQDGAIVPVTDSDIDLGTTSLRFKDTFTDSITTTGNVDVGGNLTVTGTTTFNGGTITMGDAATDNVVFGADVDSSIIPDDDDTYDLGSSSQEWRNLFIDGTANIDSLVADTADINGGTVDGAVIGGSSAAAITGTTITGTSFVIGSADISEAELETIDGVTAGTVSASKAIVVDSNKDITGGRNITITGELDAATLDISGDADIDGTLETDALSINGTTVTSTAAELNILDGVTSTAAELNILDGVTATATEINLLDGVTSTTAELNILDGVTSTATELNLLDGVTATTTELNYVDVATAGTVEASKAIVVDSNKDFTGARNITITGELDAATLDVSGDVDIDGTLEADAITINGTTLAETISDTVGAMVGSNTETGISVTYDDSDNTLDFVIGSGVITNAMLAGSIANSKLANSSVTISDGSNSTAVALGGTLTIQGTSNEVEVAESSGTVTVGLPAATQVTTSLGIGGGSTNGVQISQGAISIKNGGTQSYIDFYCESSNAHYARLQAPAHSAFSGNITLTLPATTGTLALTSGDITGNAATATALATARTIHGVSFDGTANIDLTEVIQDTVGAMVTGNTESNITVTYEDSDGTLDFSVTGGGSVSEAFKTISVSGQDDVVADSATDTLTLVAGSNMTITTSASGDTITFASSGSGGSQNLFSTIAVSGQSNVVADSTTDTLTLVAGSGMTITTDASGDSITFASSGSGSGSGSTSEFAKNTFTGDGSTTAFTLTKTMSSEDGLIVFIDGVYQADNVYSVSGTTLTFATAPVNSRVIEVFQLEGGIVGTAPVVNTMTGDGSDTTLTLSVAPISENQTFVTIDGVVQHKSTYSVSGTTLTFSAAPPTGTAVECITFTNVTAATDLVVDSFTGDGSDTTFTLSRQPLTENNTQVYLSGVYQQKSVYSISGTTLTFATAPANGVSIEVVSMASASVNSAAILQDADNDTKIQVEESTDEDTIRFDIAGAEDFTMTANSFNVLAGSKIDLNGTELILDDDGDTSITADTDDQIDFKTGGSDRVTIDSSGNVGIGTTSPTNDSGYSTLSLSNTTGGQVVFKDDGTTMAGILGNATNLGFTTVGNRYINFTTNSSERMRIDGSGNVGIGNTSPRQKFNVTGPLVSTGALSTLGAAGSYTDGAFNATAVDYYNDGARSWSWGSSSARGTFNWYQLENDGQNQINSMALDTSGNLLVGVTSAYNSGHTIYKSGSVPLNISRGDGGASNSLILGYGSGTTLRIAIRGDGDIENTNNSYGALSDKRLKSNIVDANSQLEDIKKVKVRKYTLNSTGETHIGVIAQELEEAGMSGLVTESEDTEYKGVKYSILFMKAIKAIQEQQEQIEALQSEINTLKGE